MQRRVHSETKKEWRDEDHATDVLSMSQHIPELEIPMVSNLKMSILVNYSRSMKNWPIYSFFSLCWVTSWFLLRQLLDKLKNEAIHFLMRYAFFWLVLVARHVYVSIICFLPPPPSCYTPDNFRLFRPIPSISATSVSSSGKIQDDMDAFQCHPEEI